MPRAIYYPSMCMNSAIFYSTILRRMENTSREYTSIYVMHKRYNFIWCLSFHVKKCEPKNVHNRKCTYIMNTYTHPLNASMALLGGGEGECWVFVSSLLHVSKNTHLWDSAVFCQLSRDLFNMVVTRLHMNVVMRKCDVSFT